MESKMGRVIAAAPACRSARPWLVPVMVLLGACALIACRKDGRSRDVVSSSAGKIATVARAKPAVPRHARAKSPVHARPATRAAADTDTTARQPIRPVYNRSPETEPAPVTHEPSEMKPIHSWDSHGFGAWKTTPAPVKAQFVWDSTLQDTVMEMSYGPWNVPSNRTFGPGHLYFPIPASAQPLHSVYLRAQLKFESGWRQNPSNDQKLFQLFSDQRQTVGILLYGGNERMRLMVYALNRDDPGYNGVPLGQVVRGKPFVRPPPDLFTTGSWHTIEVLIIGNTPGVKNGRVKTWLDGRLQTDVSDVMWTSAGQTGKFGQFDLNPLWGGGGGILTTTQSLRVGRIELSGSSEYLTGPLQ